jgi:peroxiredoxin
MNFKITLFRALALMIMLTITAQLKAQQQYNIQGTLGKDKQGKIMLIYTDADGKYVKDSAQVKDGVFVLSGTIAEPVHAELELNPSTLGRTPDADVNDFFLDPGKITVTSTSGMLKSTITGGEAQADFARIMLDLNAVGYRGRQLDTLSQKYSADGNDEGLKSLRAEGQKLLQKRMDIQSAFVKEHPDSFVAFSLWLRRYKRGVLTLSVVEPGFNAFSEKIKNSASGKRMAKRIALAKALEPGNPSIDFTLPDTSGKMVSLSSFRGKNVLLCFWYRNFVPFETFSFLMTKINKLSASDNLAVVSVYYNMNNSDWKTILKENGMTWTNLIDKNGIMNNESVSEVAKAYDIANNDIVQWILIGPDGKVLSRELNLAGDPVADVKKLLTK